jgi:DNA-binding protein HU-beta
MNKAEFIDHITKEHKCTKVEAEKIINIFTSSVTDVLSLGKEVSFIGFGKFYTGKVAEREGRNPKTGDKLTIAAYVQPRFTAGSSLKSSCNIKKTK